MASSRLPDRRIPVLLSAHEPDLIAQDAAAILEFLARQTNVASVSAVASTLLRRRRLRRHRAVIRAADVAELVTGLGALAGGDEHPLVARASANAVARTAFVFPGQGNQWSSMGADAYRQLPVYRADADRCAEAFVAAGMPSPLPYLLDDPAEQRWSQVEIQAAQFTHSVGLAQVWRSCGVLPDITVGHSLGEAAAAYIAGAVALPDAVGVVGARATVVSQLPGSYGMAVLGVDADEAEQLIAAVPGWLEVSAVNSASSTVVSGDCDAVDGVVRLAEERGVFARSIAVDYPGHTSALEPLRPRFEELLPASAFNDAPVEFVGSALGAVVGAGADFTDYWYRNLRNTVRFDRAVAAAIERGVNVFVELSAHPSLLYVLTDLVNEASTVLVGSGARDEPIIDRLSANIAAAALADSGYRWADLTDFDAHPPLWAFPNAPMRAVHFWAKPEPLPPLPGKAIAVAYERWEPNEAASTTRNASRRVAVIEPGETAGSLARRLVDAVVAHDDCELASPDDADITVIIAPAFEQPCPAAAAEALIEAGPPDYRRLVGPRSRTVWLVTVCGEQVQAGEPAGLPAQAGLAALHRSVGFEFPDKTFGHLDLPSRNIAAEEALDCVDVLLGDVDEVALREGENWDIRRYIRRLREVNGSMPQRALEGAVLDNVVITGGSGTIGLGYARRCIDQGARRVLFLSRRGIEQADLERLAGGHDVDLRAPACDITDADSVRLAAAEHAGDGASFLIHAAGTANFDPHDRLTSTGLADMFGAKVTGMVRLSEEWPLRQDVRIVLCSSVSGLWGGYGHGAYAASNRMLDVLASRLRAKGLDCASVRWGLWQGTKIASPDEIARIERSGLVAMDPDEAITASLCQHDGDPVIIAADFDRLRLFFDSQGIPTPFATPPAVQETEPAGDDVKERAVDQVVCTEVAALLGIGSPASVDLDAALVDLGLDSLLAVDLRQRLIRAIGRTASLGRLLGGITGAELIDVLQSAQPDDGGSPGPGTAVAPEASAGVPPASVDDTVPPDATGVAGGLGTGDREELA
ncbi:mycobactin polyketide synthase MbtD [Candidatus Mycobacterium methanotrophicum]|uniref:Mycobactin polyketide synthase MbtD n=1 Tax=Candidatus Mycobacterium methanotrophicum TaxID=2943498 RepID=A0ABY4QMC7_9MYCO|nr:mycobactin polyketide synthase MbtD [Candidatus Mycobacterium methanotrophicum]UQX11764.1 mycobactin polyketide synthase MbtD [Candidatus Mycobacterium methanotrophicum]